MAVQATIESPLFAQSSWLNAMSETWWAMQNAQW